MKLCYTVATPETRDARMLAMRGELKECFATLSELGYQGAELMVRDPSQLDPSAIRDLARRCGLEIPAVSTGQLAAEDGLNLSSADPELRRRSIDRVKEVIEFAACLSAQVNIGSLRGRLPAGAGRDTALCAATESFAELLDHARENGVGVAIEPQNRYVINWLNNIDETLAWTEKFAGGNCTILFDVYHAFLEEASLSASLIRGFSKVSHIQFSDTNRRAPGEGQANFPEIIRVLKALGYSRYLSIETLQHPESRGAAESAARFLQRWL